MAEYFFYPKAKTTDARVVSTLLRVYDYYLLVRDGY